jgi:hypothetical protein
MRAAASSRPGFQGAHAAVAWRQRPTRGFTAVLSPYSYSCSHTRHRAQRCWAPAKIRLCAEEMCRTTLSRSATGSIPRWMLALARAPSPSNGAYSCREWRNRANRQSFSKNVSGPPRRSNYWPPPLAACVRHGRPLAVAPRSVPQHLPPWPTESLWASMLPNQSSSSDWALLPISIGMVDVYTAV